jgi:hypothetical protein
MALDGNGGIAGESMNMQMAKQRAPTSTNLRPSDVRATGKSCLGSLEALWKHEAEKRCAIPTDRA